jgi:hypothetical protein
MHFSLYPVSTLSHKRYQQAAKEDSMSDIQNETNESTYGTKKAAILGARRALTKLGIKEPMTMVHFNVIQTDDRWSWTPINDGGPAPFSESKQRLAQAAAVAIKAAEKPATVQPPAPTTQEAAQGACNVEQPSLNVPSASRSKRMSETQETTAGNIKHRAGSDVRNGVRRPSDPQGACGIIWATLDQFIAEGKEANLKNLREVGEPLGWKPGNITSEFYAWRRFNGINAEPRIATPRAPRKKKADAEAAA